MRRLKVGHAPDYAFLFGLFILVSFGLLMLSSASSDLGKIKFNDTYYYLKHQLYFGFSLGLAGFLLLSFFHYRHLMKVALPLLLVSIFVLVLVFTPLGLKHGSAARWIDLGFTSLQPAEIVKFTFIAYLAAWLSSTIASRRRQTDFLGGYLPFLVMSGVIGILIVLQPSTTTLAIIMGAALITYFISGAKLRYVFLTILLGIFCLALVILVTRDYRFERLTTFFSKNVETQGRNYQLNQSLIAISSGGVWGVGFGQSTSKFRYLPEPIGDSMLAVIAEELGFLGAMLTLFLFVFITYRAFVIAKNSRDQFAKLLVVGFSSVIVLQAFIHMGAISGLVPLTGVPLPFISYGGTSLMVFLTMAGVIVNISKYTD